ncbi:Hypothetical protein PHPALM_3485 [Phytophthora palmivora]|uniref:Uncharacterized protein n=1 Tax=Phytophthora palmivora TaxID=4796 RepID=A0A2P4YMF1_9STRA|nr:Hypothetical protein PHPALM_3485 [Phytophthora palmivora]
MAKITSFMRVTKQPKAHGKKVDASSTVKKQRAAKDKKEMMDLSDEESGMHIPTFIYETVKYKHKHEKYGVSKELKMKYYNIPKDFETNAKFGCYSGLTFEKRLSRAYSMGLLPLKRGKKGESLILPANKFKLAFGDQLTKNCR